MRFIVGTSKRIVAFDKANNFQPQEVHKGHVYGITFDNEHIYAIERARPRERMVVIDKDLKVVRKSEVGSSHVHQALYDPTVDRLYICSTGNNSLYEWNLKTNKRVGMHRWAPCSRDANHINSVFRDDNGDLYVYEHCVSATNATAKGKRDGGVRRLNDKYKSDKVWRIGHAGHNVMVRDGWMYVLDSFNRKYLRKRLDADVNGEAEEILNTDEYPGFAPRGLAVSDDVTLIGLTQLKSRAMRDTAHPGKVIIYDTKTLEKIRDIPINFGQIYEVRRLDAVDYAHNGIVFLS